MFEMMGSLFTWAVAVALAAGQVPDMNRTAGLGFALLILALANGSDALLTRAQGKKGHPFSSSVKKVTSSEALVCLIGLNSAMFSLFFGRLKGR